MAGINSERCYVLSESVVLAGEQAPLPKNWLAELTAICAKTSGAEVSSLKKSFAKHVGPKSTYSSKSLLLDGLKEIYQRVTEKGDKALEDSEKAAIVDKLLEEIGECTPGFHDRTNDTVNGFHLPESMDALLGQIRKGIVEATARQATNEVHAHNRFFVVAKELGYGVRPPNPNDSHKGAFTDDVIGEKITTAFDIHYKPLSIIKQLKESIEGVLHSQYNYSHVNKEGYKAGEYEKWMAYLEKILGSKLKEEDYLISDDDSNIIDLNWPKITHSLFRYLIDKKYLELSAAEVNTMNSLLQAQLPVDKQPAETKEIDVSGLFAPGGLIQNTSELSSLLATLDNASYEIQLNLIKGYIDRFGFGPQAVWELTQARPADKNFAAVVKAFIEENYSQELKAYADSLLNKVAECLRKGTELPSDLRYLSLLDQHDQVNILNDVRSYYNENTLIYALRKQPQMVAPLLDVISEFPQEQQKEILNEKMGNDPSAPNAQTVGTAGCNALALAYRYQPQTIPALLNAISHLMPDNQVEIFKTTRERTSGVMQRSMLDSLILNQPQVITAFFTAIPLNKYKNLIYDDLVYNLTKEKQYNQNYYIPIMLAARYEPRAIAPLLEAMTQLKEKDRLQVLNWTSREGNAFFVAAKYHPESLIPMLKFVFTLPPKEQSQIEIPELKNIIPLLKRESLEQLGKIKGSKVLFDVFATQTHEDKQKVLNFSLTKFLFSLCHDKNNEQIQNDFRQLITFANTHRNIFSLKRGNTASCDDLIKKLSQVGEKEKEKLTEALGLAIDGKDKSPKAFTVALEKYIKSMPKVAEVPVVEQDPSQGLH